MLQNIHIQNFRCFEDFKTNGFERINLIGGKNNSGKTCLLEAIGTFSKNFSAEQLFYLRSSNIESVFNKNYTIPLLTISSLFKGNEIKLEARLEGNGLKTEKSESTPGISIDFISQKKEIPALKILESFDDFDAKLLKYKLINILKIVDERIEDIRTFKTKEGLFIQPVNEQYEPLSNFGDATNNLLRYFTPIFEKELHLPRLDNFSILLIDEIENGLHYTAHDAFWKNIFTLAKELNVQIFATTHSLEMITAFNEVANKQGEGAYFEMFRNKENGKVSAIKHEPDILEYELETKENFRGEQL